MGTRHLTLVQLDGDYRIAQYGQWDGYPSGQGKTVLEFLSSWNRPKFEKKLRSARWITKEESDQIDKEFHVRDGWITMAQGVRLAEKYPELSRDTGAKILKLVQNRRPGIKLQDSREFAGDSLFCEWAYVIDLDHNALEVYQGFNQKPVDPTERFAKFRQPDNKYHPVRVCKVYSLDHLPTVEQLVSDCQEEEA